MRPPKELQEQRAGIAPASLRGTFVPAPAPSAGYGAAPGGDDLVGRLVYELRAMLRDLSNINARLPSTIHAPYRAQAFAFESVQALSAGPGPSIAVTFGGNAAVPGGMAGAIHTVGVYAATFNRDTLADIYDFAGAGAAAVRWTLTKSNLAVPGFQNRLVGSTFGENITDAAGQNVQLCTYPMPQPRAPIPLLPGDTLQIDFGAISPASVDAIVHVAGYLYPQELDEDGVRGTLADRDRGG